MPVVFHPCLQMPMSIITATSVKTRSSASNHAPANRKASSRPLSVGQRLVRWVEQRLGRRIQVRGHGLQMRVTLKKVTPATEALQLPGMVQLRSLSKDRLALMQKELRGLLRQHPQTKKLLRHLAYVERTLRHDGLKAVDDLPLDVLSKALTQLESLVVNWSALGLGEMRSRLSLLVKNKKILALHMDGAAQPTEMDHSQRADVCEVSHSVFEEMDRSWRGQVPPTLTQALSNARPA
jgi:hypothetical protein